jgi:hypothetical protein
MIFYLEFPTRILSIKTLQGDRTGRIVDCGMILKLSLNSCPHLNYQIIHFLHTSHSLYKNSKSSTQETYWKLCGWLIPCYWLQSKHMNRFYDKIVIFVWNPAVVLKFHISILNFGGSNNFECRICIE